MKTVHYFIILAVAIIAGIAFFSAGEAPAISSNPATNVNTTIPPVNDVNPPRMSRRDARRACTEELGGNPGHQEMNRCMNAKMGDDGKKKKDGKKKRKNKRK